MLFYLLKPSNDLNLLFEVNPYLCNQKFLVLEKWFETNIQNSYASKSIIKELSKQTKLTQKQVSKWIYNARAKRSKTKKHFTKDQLNVLNDFFQATTHLPKQEDIEKLSVQINEPGDRIKRWFFRKRFEYKNSKK